MRFTKEDTLCMKGIAILIMFFHHNFLGPDRWLDSAISFYPFSETSVIYLAKFFKICVGMFVFLTGYGMMASVKDKIKTDAEMRKYILNRYLSLMLGFLLIFLIVQLLSAPTGRFREIYGQGINAWIYFTVDGLGLAHLLETPTFCPTWWYMSLAILLIVVFPIFWKLLNKYQGILLWIVILLPMAFKLETTDFVRWSFCYCLGMYCAEHNLLAKIKIRYINLNIIRKIAIFIIMLWGLMMVIKFRQSEVFGWKYIAIWEGVASFYIILFSYMFLLCCKPLKVTLQFLGKHSMNMFLTHTFLRAIYFHDFMYSFYYMWLDYIVLIVISVAISIAIEMLKMLIKYDDVSIKVKRYINEKLRLN